MESIARNDIIKELMQNKVDLAVEKAPNAPKLPHTWAFAISARAIFFKQKLTLDPITGKIIQDSKKEGKLVPSEIVFKLLQKAMQGSQNKKFLIDGFPRSEENLAAAENTLKIEPDAVLFFDCSEEEMIRRLLNRNQERVDDSIDTITKRLKVYYDSTPPAINYYSSKGKIRQIDAERPIEEVFDAIKGVFSELKAEPGKNN